ncbi:hypothetical protein VNO80_07330 [Phaseolus coccineus]|uniref:Uncharacterized protein n=1 Tax=Phaseolus coccineus TaxID=3886 RepID=A0AAN9RFA9_PHACN
MSRGSSRALINLGSCALLKLRCCNLVFCLLLSVLPICFSCPKPVSRVMVAWQLIGLSMEIYDVYLKERNQFRAPLAAFQIRQQKLNAGEHSSNDSCWARETAALGRGLIGGNGNLADFLVAKTFCDLEPIYTFERTYDINTLVTSREVTGFASFKPAAQKSRL